MSLKIRLLLTVVPLALCGMATLATLNGLGAVSIVMYIIAALSFVVIGLYGFPTRPRH